jgi:hypothetical protein
LITKKIISKLAKNLRQLKASVQRPSQSKLGQNSTSRFYNRWRMLHKRIRTLLPTRRDWLSQRKSWWSMLRPRPSEKMLLPFMPICNIREIKLGFQGRDRSVLPNLLYKQQEVTSPSEQTKKMSWLPRVENQQSNFTRLRTPTTLIKNEH